MEAEVSTRESRWAARDAQRQANSKLAFEAAQARARRRQSISLTDRVDAAKERLAGVNTAGAIQLIQSVSTADYDVYLIAEEYGQARRGVLKQFGAPRNSVKTAYMAEAGLASPDHTPDEGVKE